MSWGLSVLAASMHTARGVPVPDFNQPENSCGSLVQHEPIGANYRSWNPNLCALDVGRLHAERNGLFACNVQTYICPQVHRYHPPLIYGRTMGLQPELTVGLALCRVEKGLNGHPCYALITYK